MEKKMIPQIMWAWYDNNEKKFYHIYRAKFMVEMCSPDGFKFKEKTGQGKIIQVIIQKYKG